MRRGQSHKHFELLCAKWKRLEGTRTFFLLLSLPTTRYTNFLHNCAINFSGRFSFNFKFCECFQHIFDTELIFNIYPIWINIKSIIELFAFASRTKFYNRILKSSTPRAFSFFSIWFHFCSRFSSTSAAVGVDFSFTSGCLFF
jgi:hypothetical protein